MPNAAVELEPNLQHALGPTTLLRFEGVDLNGDFRRRFFIQQANKTPAHQLRAKTQVGVFGQRIVLPAAAHLNRFSSPDTCGAVEIEEVTAAIARRLLNHKMA